MTDDRNIYDDNITTKKDDFVIIPEAIHEMCCGVMFFFT